MRYCALTGSTRRQLEHDVEHGFPYLPPGSQLVLDRVSQAIVLENVRAAVRSSKKDLLSDVRSYVLGGTEQPSLTLRAYLDASRATMVDVYRSSGSYRSWTGLLRAAGAGTRTGGADEVALLRRVPAVVHVDDVERAAAYAAIAAEDGPRYGDLDEREQRLARMLFFTLWPNRGGFATHHVGFRHLREHPAVVDEIQQVMAGAPERAQHVARFLGMALTHLPVLVHATYRREELLAGLGYAHLGRGASGHVGGVQWCPDEQVDALLVNLTKDPDSFSPTTMYRDYALSTDICHWESQNATSLRSPTGQRYVHHREQGSHVVLFAREAPTDEVGAAPFLCLGAADHVSHRGERPMAITWRMHRSLPADVVAAAWAATA